MSQGRTIRVALDVRVGRRGRQEIRTRTNGESRRRVPQGRVPRVARLLALAHRFRQLIEDGHVRDRATLARLCGVTRAHITRIMRLLDLAPDIQEAVLFLPRTVRGRDPIRHADLLAIVREPTWAAQKLQWDALATADQLQEGDFAGHVE